MEITSNYPMKKLVANEQSPIFGARAYFRRSAQDGQSLHSPPTSNRVNPSSPFLQPRSVRLDFDTATHGRSSGPIQRPNLVSTQMSRTHDTFQPSRIESENETIFRLRQKLSETVNSIKILKESVLVTLCDPKDHSHLRSGGYLTDRFDSLLQNLQVSDSNRQQLSSSAKPIAHCRCETSVADLADSLVIPEADDEAFTEEDWPAAMTWPLRMLMGQSTLAEDEPRNPRLLRRRSRLVSIGDADAAVVAAAAAAAAATTGGTSKKLSLPAAGWEAVRRAPLRAASESLTGLPSPPPPAGAFGSHMRRLSNVMGSSWRGRDPHEAMNQQRGSFGRAFRSLTRLMTSGGASDGDAAEKAAGDSDGVDEGEQGHGGGSAGVAAHHLDEGEQLAVWPYLRLGWLTALMLADWSLFLAMLFWPKEDFMCALFGSKRHEQSSTPVFIAVWVLLGLHIMDLVALPLLMFHIDSLEANILFAQAWSRDVTGRRLGCFLFPSVAGGRSRALFNAFYCFVIILSAAAADANRELCLVEEGDDGKSAGYRIAKRVHLCAALLRCVVAMQQMTRVIREFRLRLQRAVSVNKRRFVDPGMGLDLDLTYICDRLVAMAVPAVDSAPHRNDIREVARFFATRHYGRFLIFNLCEDFESNGNGGYDCKLLYDQVQKLPFRDHNAPPLAVLVSFCRQATSWLNNHPNNLVAVHCQGGKGRTGTFCASLLLWTRFCNTAEEALRYYMMRRTDIRLRGEVLQGVSAPSQIRYVSYVERVLAPGGRERLAAPARRLIDAVAIHTLPYPERGGRVAVQAANSMFGGGIGVRPPTRLVMIIESLGTIQYDSGRRCGLLELNPRGFPADTVVFRFETEGVLVSGDVTIRFYRFPPQTRMPGEHDEDLSGIRAHGLSGNSVVNHAQTSALLGPGAKTLRYGEAVGRQMCFVTFHTGFHPGDRRLIFGKTEVDGAHDKPLEDFHENFAVSIEFRSNPTAAESVANEIPSAALERTKGNFKGGGGAVGAEFRRTLSASVRASSNSLHRTPTDWSHQPPTSLTGARLMALYEGVTRVMETACPVPLSFRRGEVLYDPGRPEPHRCLWQMVSGVAEYGPRDLSMEPPFRINRGDSISGLQIGAGELFGELRFMLGFDGTASAFRLRARSEVVQVRVLRLEPNGPAMPVCSQRFSVHELACLYELLAKILNVKNRLLTAQMARLCIKPRSVKRDATSRTRSVEDRIVKRVIKEMRLSPQSHFLRMAHANLFSRNGCECSGHLLVFFNEVAFFAAAASSGPLAAVLPNVTGRSGPRPGRGLKLLLKEIPAVSAFGKRLSLFVRLQKPKDFELVHRPRTLVVGTLGMELHHDTSTHGFASGNVAGAAGLHDERFRAIAAVATPAAEWKGPASHSDSSKLGSASAESASGWEMCLHFDLGDEKNAEDMQKIIASRISETLRETAAYYGSSSTSVQASASGHGGQGRIRRRGSWTMGIGSDRGPGFGYLLPGESATAEEKEAVQLILAEARPCHFRAGEEIVSQGASGRELFHILSGFCVCTSLAGDELVRYGPGEFFGDVTFVDSGDGGASSCVVAEDEVECLAVGYEDVDQLSTARPLAVVRFWRALATAAAIRLRKQHLAVEMRRVAVATSHP